MFICVCVNIYVYTTLGMCIPQYSCGGLRKSSSNGPVIVDFPLVWDQVSPFLLAVVSTKPASLHTSEIPPSSSSLLATGIQPLHKWVIVPGFMWILGIQTQVLILAQQTLCPLKCLHSSPDNDFYATVNVNVCTCSVLYDMLLGVHLSRCHMAVLRYENEPPNHISDMQGYSWTHSELYSFWNHNLNLWTLFPALPPT